MVKAKAVTLLAISGGLFVLALVVLLTNLGNRCTVHVFTTSVENVRVGTALAYAAVLGGVLWVIWRVCIPRGYRLLKQAQLADEQRGRQERLDQLVAEDDTRAAERAKSEEQGETEKP